MPRKSVFVAVLLTAVLAVMALGAGQKPKGPVKTKRPTIATTVLQIEGMSCYSCVARVTKALKNVNGVKDAHVNLKSRTGEVQYVPGTVTADSLARLVNQLGYRAKPIASSEKP